MKGCRGWLERDHEIVRTPVVLEPDAHEVHRWDAEYSNLVVVTGQVGVLDGVANGCRGGLGVWPFVDLERRIIIAIG